MAWKPEHLRGTEAWFNPWPIKYLMPAIKWFPLYWPNAEWEVVSFPPSFPREANKPPDGAIGPWWKMLPKDQWPIAAARPSRAPVSNQRGPPEEWNSALCIQLAGRWEASFDDCGGRPKYSLHAMQYSLHAMHVTLLSFAIAT
jgi:hypothetical protein